MERIDKLISYCDSLFWKVKSRQNEFSLMGFYDGLILDYYFENSVYSYDYIDVYDYFLTVAHVNIDETRTLLQNIEHICIENKIAMISCILNLINRTTFQLDFDKMQVINKIKSVLTQCGFFIDEKDQEYIVRVEKIKFLGSYCEIVELSPDLYKKRLQKKYAQSPQWLLRMEREYDNLQKLSASKYVLNAYTYNSKEHSFTMEVCDGSLDDIIKDMSEDKIITVIHDLLYGMSDVHSNGIIHRDLHLGNILLKGDGYVLSDFGLSKDTMIASDFKSSKTPKSSHFFMDPAAKDDFNKLDKLTDIYSIGKIIEYLISGKDIAKDYQFIILKATDSNRNNRYKSVVEMIEDFESVVHSERKQKEIKQIIEEIKANKFNIDTSQFINNLLLNNKLSMFLVNNKCYNFGKMILKFNDAYQLSICENIEKTYVNATGYNGWSNYDIFGDISCYIIDNSSNIMLKKIAFKILKGCSCRFQYNDLYQYYLINYPELVD